MSQTQLRPRDTPPIVYIARPRFEAANHRRRLKRSLQLDVDTSELPFWLESITVEKLSHINQIKNEVCVANTSLCQSTVVISTFVLLFMEII